MSEIRVRIIGESAIEGGGRQIRPKADVLFALALLLTVERGRRLPRPEIRAMLWPHESEDRAQHSLRQMLYKLRAMGLPISDTAGGLSVSTTDVWVDFMDGEPESDPRFREALLMPSGVSILPGFDAERSQALTDWVDRVRSRAEGTVRGHLLGRIAAARQAGRWDQMEQAARNCLQVDPLNEAATLSLAESLALSGSKATAVRLIEEYESGLGNSDKSLALQPRLLKKRITGALGESIAKGQEVTPLLERESLLTSLVELSCGRSPKGAGCTVLLSGASGMGKSRLLEELRKRLVLLGQRHVGVAFHSADEPPEQAMIRLASQLNQLPGALGAPPASYSLVSHLASGTLAASDIPLAAHPEVLGNAIIDVAAAIADDAPLVVLIDNSDKAPPELSSLVAGLASHAASGP